MRPSEIFYLKDYHVCVFVDYYVPTIKNLN